MLFVALLIAVASADYIIGDYMKTPVGYIHKDCVHGVPSGSEIIDGDDEVTVKTPSGIIETYDHCEHSMDQPSIMEEIGATGSGWQVYTKMNSGPSSDVFLGDWKVPVVPTRNGQILYTFTGMQNIDWVPPEKEPSQPFDIIQPVMQYGRTPAGGGDYWGLASWYVTLKAGAYHSKVIKLEPGDTVFGNMTRTGPETFFINGVDTRTNENATLTISKSLLSSQPWIYVTLEVYDVTSCDQYPKSGTPMPYTNLQLFESGRQSPITWTVGTNGQNPPVCGATIKVIDGTAVTITF
eukprot:235392_1